MRNAGKVSSEEVSRRPPAGAILLRASARGEPLAAASGRSVTFVASDPSVGRDMHTIQPGAWQAANFLRNPVFLWSHRADEPPIGRVTNLYTTARARLMAAVEYAERDAYPFADTIDQLVKQGFLSAVSTGWIPLEWKAARDRSQPGGLDFTLVELLELSQVPVPALPTALAAGRAAGVDITPFAAWAERALDRPRPAEGRTAITREDLVMIRNAAGAAKVYAAPRHSPFERSARRRRRLRQLRPFSSGGRARSVAGDKRSSPDPRAQTGAAFETDPTAGGFLVPTTYVESLVASMYDEAVIAPFATAWRPTSQPRPSFLALMKRAARMARAGAAPRPIGASKRRMSAPSMPKFRAVEFGAHKLYAVCFASAELIADAPMLGAYMTRAFAAEMSFKLDQAIVSGQGSGQPQGVLFSQALITVAKDTSQAAATISYNNVENMWAALPVPCRRRGVWLIHELVEKQFSDANFVTAASVAMYMPAAAGGNEFPLLKGRPLIQIEQGKPVGTTGDIILCDFSQYGIVDGGLKANLSMEADFDHDQGIFRFAWRVDGKTLWSSPVTSYSNSTQRSPFVALATRTSRDSKRRPAPPTLRQGRRGPCPGRAGRIFQLKSKRKNGRRHLHFIRRRHRPARGGVRKGESRGARAHCRNSIKPPTRSARQAPPPIPISAST